MESPDTYTMVFLMLAIWSILTGFFIVGELAVRLFQHIIYKRQLRRRINDVIRRD